LASLVEPNSIDSSSADQDVCGGEMAVELLQNLDVSKSNGPDGISAKC